MKKVLIHTPYEGNLGLKIIEGIAEYMRLHEPWQLNIPGMTGMPREVDLATWEGDGVILPVLNTQILDILRARKLHFVNITAFPGIPTVRHDNVAMGRLGALHLMSQGYRNFVYAGLPGRMFSDQREEGFLQTLSQNGFQATRWDATRFRKEDGGHIAVLLRDQPLPLGVLLYSDDYAPFVYQQFQEMDLSIPDQVAVLGMDDKLLSLTLSPSMSSVVPDVFQMGFAAAEMLHLQFQGNPPPHSPVLISPLGVHARGSTSAFGFSDEIVAEAMRFIRNKAQKGLLVDEVVRHVNLSRRSLERRFEHVIGHSLWQEMRRVQIEHVKNLLISTNWPIKRISGESAFPQPSRLTQIFREETGETPMEYRRRHRV